MTLIGARTFIASRISAEIAYFAFMPANVCRHGNRASVCGDNYTGYVRADTAVIAHDLNSYGIGLCRDEIYLAKTRSDKIRPTVRPRRHCRGHVYSFAVDCELIRVIEVIHCFALVGNEIQHRLAVGVDVCLECYVRAFIARKIADISVFVARRSEKCGRAYRHAVAQRAAVADVYFRLCPLVVAERRRLALKLERRRAVETYTVYIVAATFGNLHYLHCVQSFLERDVAETDVAELDPTLLALEIYARAAAFDHFAVDKHGDRAEKRRIPVVLADRYYKLCDRTALRIDVKSYRCAYVCGNSADIRLLRAGFLRHVRHTDVTFYRACAKLDLTVLRLERVQLARQRRRRRRCGAVIDRIHRARRDYRREYGGKPDGTSYDRDDLVLFRQSRIAAPYVYEKALESFFLLVRARRFNVSSVALCHIHFFELTRTEHRAEYCHYRACDKQAHRNSLKRNERVFPPRRYVAELRICGYIVHTVGMKLIVQYSVARLAHGESDGRIVLIAVPSLVVTAVHPQILTRDHSARHCARIELVIGYRGVGDGNARKAPFLAQYVGQKPAVTARPNTADTVVRGHYTVGFALDNASLERLEINFAYGLFVSPNRAAVTVLFLIVEHEMLCEHDNAAALKSARFRREHLARDKPVLAVILEVTPRKRRTVYTCARTVYRGIARMQHFHAERVAYLFYERKIPRSRQNLLRRKTHIRLKPRANVALDARRSVVSLYLFRSDIRYSGYAAIAVREQPALLLPSHLIEQIVPERIVEVIFHEVYQPQSVLLFIFFSALVELVETVLRHGYFTRNGKLIRRFCRDFVTVLHILYHLGVYARKAHARGIRSRPILARKIRDMLIGSARVNVYIRIIETVGYLKAFCGFGVFNEIVGVHTYKLCEIGFSVVVHAVRVGAALARENVVERIVRINADGKVIVAPLEYVRLFAVAVVRFEILALYRDGERLAFFRLNDVGLVEPYKLDSRFFDTRIDIVLGVRLLQINLKNLFTRQIAVVGDLYRDFVVVAFLLDLKIAVLEIGIRESVTERISNLVGILPARVGVSGGHARRARRIAAAVHVGVILAEHRVFVPRFVIAVTHVYAFLINDVSVVHRHFVVFGHAAFARELHIAEVGGHGRTVMIERDRIGKTSARRDRAREHVRYLRVRRAAAHAYPYARIDAEVFYVFHLQRACRVYEQHDALDLTRFAERNEPLYNVVLVRRKIHIVVVQVIIGVNALAVVDARIEICVPVLARVAGNGHDSRVAVFGHRIGHVAYSRRIERVPRYFANTVFPIVIVADALFRLVADNVVAVIRF